MDNIEMHNIQVEINPWLKILLDDFLEESRFSGNTATLRLDPAGPVSLVREGMKCLASLEKSGTIEGRVAEVSRDNGSMAVALLFPDEKRRLT